MDSAHENVIPCEKVIDKVHLSNVHEAMTMTITMAAVPTEQALETRNSRSSETQCT